jgi:hypothetical protein
VRLATLSCHSLDRPIPHPVHTIVHTLPNKKVWSGLDAANGDNGGQSAGQLRLSQLLPKVCVESVGREGKGTSVYEKECAGVENGRLEGSRGVPSCCFDYVPVACCPLPFEISV